MTMRHVWLGMLILVPALAAPAQSQDRPQGPPDSMQGRPGSRMSEPMRERVERRFAERVRQELKLTDDQATRLKATAEQYATKRREIRTREHDVRRALTSQLQPGIAADNDSIAHLTDDLVGLRLRYVENFRDELQDLSKFLTPVQRARLVIMRERLFRAADRARERRDGSSAERGRRGNQGNRPMRPQP